MVIFVSKASMDESCKISKLKEDATLFKICVMSRKKQLSLETVNMSELNGKYLLVTVANFRKQNHLRQIEIMRILKDRGLNVIWLNIVGAQICTYSRIKENKRVWLEKSFLL